MIHPWHMWGNAANLTLHPGLDRAQNGQLARVEYKRPESWRFMFYARVLRSNVSATPANVLVTFNVFTGVGRANLQINGNPFETYLFNIALTGEQGATPVKFSTEVVGPVRVDGNTDSASVVDVIVGQDIQIGFAAALLPNPPGLLVTDEAQIEVGALLAPWHHARPDWMLHAPEPERFAGEEIAGR